jgi:hypothetical protein
VTTRSFGSIIEHATNNGEKRVYAKYVFRNQVFSNVFTDRPSAEKWLAAEEQKKHDLVNRERAEGVVAGTMAAARRLTVLQTINENLMWASDGDGNLWQCIRKTKKGR